MVNYHHYSPPLRWIIVHCSRFYMVSVRVICFFRAVFQPNTVDCNTSLWGINPTNSVVIPQSLLFRSIVLGWILIFRNWSIIPLTLDGCEIVIANSALRATSAIYRLVSNALSWNNCYFSHTAGRKTFFLFFSLRQWKITLIVWPIRPRAISLENREKKGSFRGPYSSKWWGQN